jgi:hypothetical protein
VHRGLSSINRSGGIGAVMPLNPPEPLVERVPLETSIGYVRTVPTSGPGVPESTSGLILARLTSVQPASPELLEEQKALMSRAVELGDQVDAFVAGVVEERLDSLSKKHSEVREAGRKQTRLINTLTEQFYEANAAWNDSRTTKQVAYDALGQATHAQQHLSQFASDNEIEDAANLVSNVQAMVEEAVEKEGRALQERNRRGDLLTQAQQELQRLMADESKLRGLLTGMPFVDPELGLENRVSAITRD